jgi:cell division protein FtsB
MRDISARIQRYRLSRYAAPIDRVRRRLRWVWLGAALWLIWVGFVSEHNLVRLWALSRECGQSEAELKRLREEITRLDIQVHDPTAQRDLAEHTLREKDGMAKPGEIIYLYRRDHPVKR